MKRIEQVLKQKGFSVDSASLEKVENTISMYEKTSKVRFKKEIKELKEVRTHIKKNLK